MSPSGARGHRWRSWNAFVAQGWRPHGAKSNAGTPWIIKHRAVRQLEGEATVKRAQKERDAFTLAGKFQLKKRRNGIVSEPLCMQIHVWIHLRLIQSLFYLQRWRVKQRRPEVKSAIFSSEIIWPWNVIFFLFSFILESENSFTKKGGKYSQSSPRRNTLVLHLNQK